MKVAHMTTVPESVNTLLRTEIEFLVSQGHEVHVISGPSEDPRYSVSLPDVVIHTVDSLSRRINPTQDVRALSDLWHLIGSLGLDVLHTHTPKAGVFGRVIGRVRAVPVVVNTTRGVPVANGLWSPAEIVFMVLELLSGLASVREFYLTDRDRKFVGFLHPWKNEVVGNGIDLTRYRIDSESRNRIRSQLGLSEDDLLVGGVGRRVAAKGIPEFCEMASQLCNEAAFVWIGGEDPQKQDRVKADHPDVTFIDFTDEMPAWLSALDIFVLPSHREGFPRSAMEAAAIGVPVVTTKIGGTIELGVDRLHVERVPVKDPVALASTVLELMKDVERRRSMSEAGLRRARDHYDGSRIARRYLEAYVDILQS